MEKENHKTVTKHWELGLATLPVKADKSPDGVISWKGGVKDISLYENGFGIICGESSGGLECMDFDNHFNDAKNRLSEFMQDVKPLVLKYKFPIEITQNGGYHLIYRCSKVDGNRKLASKWIEKNGRKVPDAVIETRGEGGYFVVAPSAGYKWIRSGVENIPTITPEDRDVLITTAISFNECVLDAKYDAQEDTGRPGDIYNNDSVAISDAKEALKKYGWVELRGGKWRRPDKDMGISATFGKVAPNIFYVFSSNAHPFEQMRAYKPFGIIGILEHNGDFNALAKELAEKYQTTKPQKKEYGRIDTSKLDVLELDDILNKAHINLSIPVEKPPLAISINNADQDNRLLTMGNFSAIIGKSKSKKTFFTSILLAAAIRNGKVDKFTGSLPSGKRNVFLFDTEQSNYDAYMTAKRAEILAGTSDNYYAFDLREFSPLQRCQIIERAFEKNGSSMGYIVIDGIADLANAVNDEVEAIRVVGLLMKWSKIYNCHITVVLHQNKSDNYATGHLGSTVMKKAEAVISVKKHEENKDVSIVSCDYIRGTRDFDDFEFEIGEDALPRITDVYQPFSENVPF